jgi:hypothetical protein
LHHSFFPSVPHTPWTFSNPLLLFAPSTSKLHSRRSPPSPPHLRADPCLMKEVIRV